MEVVVYKYHHDQGPPRLWSPILPFLEKIFGNENGNAGYESAQVQAIFCDLWYSGDHPEKGGITILVVILGVRRNFFKEVYQNDYHGVFCNRLEKWAMVIKKNRSYHGSTLRENHWWASYHDRTFYSKK